MDISKIGMRGYKMNVEFIRASFNLSYLNVPCFPVGQGETVSSIIRIFNWGSTRNFVDKDNISSPGFR